MTQSQKSWQERFDELFGGGKRYLILYDETPSSSTSYPEEVKDFIASEIEAACQDEREKVSRMIEKLWEIPLSLYCANTTCGECKEKRLAYRQALVNLEAKLKSKT